MDFYIHILCIICTQLFELHLTAQKNGCNMRANRIPMVILMYVIHSF